MLRNVPGADIERERIVVLGTNSFSGASFVAHLLQQDPQPYVIGISRSEEAHPALLPYRSAAMEELASKGFEFQRLDLNVDLDQIVDLLHTVQPHYIVNFAAQSMVSQSWSTPLDWFRTNTLALAGLVDRIQHLPGLRRFVQVSTPEVYGSCPDFIDETRHLDPSTPYAASKAAGDLVFAPYRKACNFPVAFTRAANVYGTHQQLFRIIPRCAIRILQGRKIPLEGDGTSTRWFIHIGDVARATLEIARRGENGEVYHIAPDDGGIRIVDLVRKICSILDRDFEDCVVPAPGRVGHDDAYALDCRKIRDSLDWSPRVSLDTGLREVISWVQANLAELSSLPEEYHHKP